MKNTQKLLLIWWDAVKHRKLFLRLILRIMNVKQREYISILTIMLAPPIDCMALHVGILDLNARPSGPHSIVAESQTSSSSLKGHASVYMASTPEELVHRVEEYAQAQAWHLKFFNHQQQSINTLNALIKTLLEWIDKKKNLRWSRRSEI